jgi:hypothetical protein
MHDYDTVLKMLLKAPADALLHGLTNTRIESWGDVQFRELIAKEADLVGRAENGELIHIELQSTNDPTMADRMADYSRAIYREVGVYPRQFVLYVGVAKMRMPTRLTGPFRSFRYTLVDIRRFDGEQLLNSPFLADNIVAILASWQNHVEPVRRIFQVIASLDQPARDVALKQLFIVSGLRRIGAIIEKEASNVPILDDILDHDVIGREFKKGELAILTEILKDRFGPLPDWAVERLSKYHPRELLKLSVRVLKAKSLEDFFG